MKALIYTYTGKYIDVLNPQPEDIDIRDIAHGLALCNRFAGQTQFPISVAQHSIWVATNSPNYPLAGLLHDASEAYLGDVTKWLKGSDGMAGYREAEARLQGVINKVFGCPEELPAEVKLADILMLRIEGFRGHGPGFEVKHPDYPPMTEEELAQHPPFFPWIWQTAELRFLNMFTALSNPQE